MTTMNAAVFRAVDAPMGIEQVGLANPGYGQVLVKTAAAGVCHSDLHFLDGSWPMRLPAVLGHEAAGVVERTGEGVTYVQPGDHVILLFVAFCGKCRYCNAGRPNLCQEGRLRAPTLTIDGQQTAPFLGMSAFAEYMMVPENALVRIRPDMPLDRAALIGCAVMTGIGAAINTARVAAGSTCAVIGCGGVGLNVVQGCALAGAGKIIAIDMLPNKLEMATTFGATHVIDASSTDALAAVRDLTEGGPDYAFEAIGLPQTITQAWNMVRAGGEAVIVGMAPFRSEATISATDFLSEKVLRGCMYGSTRPRVDMPRIVDLYLSGRIKLDELVTRRLPLAGINEAFDAMKNGEVARSVLVF